MKDPPGFGKIVSQTGMFDNSSIIVVYLRMISTLPAEKVGISAVAFELELKLDASRRFSHES